MAFEIDMDCENDQEGSKKKISIIDTLRTDKASYNQEKKSEEIEKPGIGPPREGNIEEALEATGNGKFNFWIAFAGGITLYAVNAECYSIGYVIPSAECDMNLDLEQKSILVTIGSAGILATQFFWGYLSDCFGRRNLMLYTLICGFLCTLGSVLVPMFWLVTLFRFLNGAFIACASGLSFAYVGEFLSDRNRSVFIVIMSIFIGLILTLIPLIAWVTGSLVPEFDLFGMHFAAWRVFLLLSGLPTIPACVALYFSPESPKYLAQAQRMDDAMVVLRKMHKINNSKKEYPLEKLTMTETPSGKKSLAFLKLFSYEYVFKTLLVCFLQSGIFATSAGLLLWYPDILQRISKSKEAVTVCQALNLNLEEFTPNEEVPLVNNTTSSCGVLIDTSVYEQNIYIGVMYMVGYIAMSFLIRRVGIKRILVIFLSSSGIAAIALYWVTTQVIIDILFLGLLVLSGLCVIVVNAAVVEIYPTYLRGMAVCITMVFGRLGSIISSSIVGYLLVWNCEVTFMLYAASLIACSLMALLLPSNKST